MYILSFMPLYEGSEGLTRVIMSSRYNLFIRSFPFGRVLIMNGSWVDIRFFVIAGSRLNILVPVLRRCAQTLENPKRKSFSCLLLPRNLDRRNSIDISKPFLRRRKSSSVSIYFFVIYVLVWKKAYSWFITLRNITHDSPIRSHFHFRGVYKLHARVKGNELAVSIQLNIFLQKWIWYKVVTCQGLIPSTFQRRSESRFKIPQDLRQIRSEVQACNFYLTFI